MQSQIHIFGNLHIWLDLNIENNVCTELEREEPSLHTIVRFIYAPETLFGQKTIKTALTHEFWIILSRLVTVVLLQELSDFALNLVLKLQNIDRFLASFVHNIRTGTGV
jgi:hypothetical protein